MHGVVSPIPSRYPAEIALIEEFGWTWRDIQEAPSVLIDELLTRIAANRKWQSERRKRDESIAQSKAKKR